eukprot:TRINITY_DN93957_c0_g1_i1.p1 TRINITY_DN93957_c0_g1~~TRINITY_DN93957_c0_g1_i1.p1  ORF type:complete len:371 (-),score=52.51 TRINITY_DN93957_c0_g1_i1:204-1316(-)
MPFPSVEVHTINGERIVLDGPICADERVEELRQRLSEQLGVHARQLDLLADGLDLADGRALGDVLESSEDATLTVIIRPCRVKLDEYEAHIDRIKPAFLEVAKLRYPTFYPIKFPPDVPTLANGFPVDVSGAVPLPEEEVEEEGQEEFVMPRNRLVEFPDPQDININMMPFVIGDKSSMPEQYRHYWGLIESCNLPADEQGKVGYLTIQESFVMAGETQRRPGLHIESPGSLAIPGEYKSQRYDWGCGAVIGDLSKVKGGIYMASNLADSCRIWNLHITDPAALCGKLGSLEHIRHLIGEGTKMKANALYWLTDATPHESLALETGSYRQFFRLVTSSLSVWYADHSTQNELVQPNPETTRTVKGSKFDK